MCFLSILGQIDGKTFDIEEMACCIDPFSLMKKAKVCERHIYPEKKLERSWRISKTVDNLCGDKTQIMMTCSVGGATIYRLSGNGVVLEGLIFSKVSQGV